MEIMFLETSETGWAVERCNSGEEVVVATAGGSSKKIPVVQDAKYVVVCWQIDRCLRDLKENPFQRRAIVDLYQLAWLLVAAGELKDRTLEALCGWCGVAPDLSTIEGRASAVRACYYRLVQRAKLGLQIEGAGREVFTHAAGRLVEVFKGLAPKEKEK